MRERIYILPTVFGMVYFFVAVLLFVGGAFAMRPLLGFFGFYLIVFFVFGALQTNENLQGLTLEASAGAARLGNKSRKRRYALRIRWRHGRLRRDYLVGDVLLPLELPLPQVPGARVSIASAFPIGLFRAWKRVGHSAARVSSFTSAAGVPGEILEHRLFRNGDRESDVDWKQTARRGHRMVKVRERLASPLSSVVRGKRFPLFLVLAVQPALLFLMNSARVAWAQMLLLADLAILWFVISSYFFPAVEAGRWRSMVASLLRVLVLSVVAFGSLAWALPDFLSNLFPEPREAHAGFSHAAWMDPGQVARVRQSNELVLRARLDRETRATPYWRGMTLEHTRDGLRWNGAVEEAPGIAEPKGELVQQQILLADPSGSRFVLDRPIVLSLDSGSTYYEAASDPNPFVPAEPVHSFRDLPEKVAPEVLELAEGWRRDGAGVEAFTEHVRDFFQKGFRYRLDPGKYPVDGLGEFLFRRREGFCEHFAGATATLLRLGGFPARVVKGFKGGDRNSLNGTYRVRAKHAHAWVETYSTSQRGWLRLDPTEWAAEGPVTEVADGALLVFGEAWLRRWETWRDQWEFAWHRMKCPRIKLSPPPAFAMWTAATLLAALLVAVGFYRRKQLPSELAFYEAHCRQMAAYGVFRRRNEGPLDFARRCAIRLPRHAREIEEVTGRYIALRYG